MNEPLPYEIIIVVICTTAKFQQVNSDIKIQSEINNHKLHHQQIRQQRKL